MGHIGTIEDLITALTENLSDRDLTKADIKSSIANAIINKRISQGLNQKDLAEKIGKSQATISKWENGDMNFTIDSLVEIAFDLEMQLTIKLKDNPIVMNKGIITTEYSKAKSKVISFPPKHSWVTSNYTDELEEM